MNTPFYPTNERTMFNSLIQDPNSIFFSTSYDPLNPYNHQGVHSAASLVSRPEQSFLPTQVPIDNHFPVRSRGFIGIDGALASSFTDQPTYSDRFSMDFDLSMPLDLMEPDGCDRSHGSPAIETTSEGSCMTSLNVPIIVPSQEINRHGPLKYILELFPALNIAGLPASIPRVPDTPYLPNHDSLQIIHYDTPRPNSPYNPNSRKRKIKAFYRYTYDCPKCNYWSDRESNTARHFEKYHTKHKKSQCKKCTKYFDNVFNVKRHQDVSCSHANHS
ncbi:hypothetical protein CLU79DRAFT_781491 [Phycomyces nitens]|nr:hypothetical protein CLU79DRAFT_781491 [Phycomyces nitens]